MRLVLTASYELKLMKCLSSQHGASPSAVTAVIVVWPAWNVEPAIVVSTPVNSSLRTRRHGRQPSAGHESTTQQPEPKMTAGGWRGESEGKEDVVGAHRFSKSATRSSCCATTTISQHQRAASSRTAENRRER